MPIRPRFAVAAVTLCLGAAEARAQCLPAVVRLLADRKYDEARAQMTAAIAKNPKDDAALACHGRISSEMDRFREAADYFEKAIKINDNVATHHLGLGSALGDLADSTSKIKQPFLARRIKAEFEKTVALDPTSVDGRTGLVEFYTRAPGVMGGSKEKAQEQLAEIKKLDPLRGHLKAAEWYVREKKNAEADKEFLAAQQVAPDSAGPGYSLGLHYQNTERWADAFAVYDRMEKRFPSEWAVRFHIGRTAALSGQQLDRGERELKALLASPPADMTKPTVAGAHHRLGMIYEKQGKKDLARAEYQHAVAINPQNEAAKRSLAALK